MEEKILQKRKDKFLKNIVDARISSAILRRKNNTDEHIMKNRSKIYHSSCLEVNEKNLKEIPDELKHNFTFMSEVISILKQSEQLEKCIELIKSNISYNVIYAVYRARLLTNELRENIPNFITDDFFLLLYNLIKTKNNLQILYESTWTLINIIYSYPKPEFIELLSSYEIILNFYNVQLNRYKNGGIDDLVNNIILLIGNIVYRRKEKIILMRDNDIIMKIAKCQMYDGEDKLSHYSLWTLSEFLYYEDISFKSEILGICADIFINYIVNFNDKKVLENSFKGLLYIKRHEEYSEILINKIIKNKIVLKIYSYDFLFHNEVISSAIILISRILSTNYSNLEYFIESNITEYLIKLLVIKDYEPLSNTILSSLELITKSDNPKINILFDSGFVKNLLENFQFFDDEKLEKIILILSNLSHKKEIEGLLNQIALELINLLKLNKKTEIQIHCLEGIYSIIQSPFSVGLINYLNNMGCKEIIENFSINCKNETVLNKVITLKNYMAEINDLEIENHVN